MWLSTYLKQDQEFLSVVKPSHYIRLAINNMSKSLIHIKNLAFNWGGHAATLVVMFFLSPYIVGKLDAVSYGIWSLLSVLTGYMGIFDLGVRASVGRHVALYLGKGDADGVDETIRAGFGFFTLSGVLVLLVGILLGWFFPDLFKGVAPEHYGTIRVLLPLMVANIWLSAIAAIYSSILAAHDRFDSARAVDMVVLGVRTAGTVFALHMGWGLWGLAGSIIVGNVCAVIGNRWSAGRCHQGLKSFPLLYSRKRFKELFGYGSYAFITSAAVKIIGQSDLVIVGVFLSVSDVRQYSVGAMLIYYSSTFVKIISRTFFPAVQRSAAAGNSLEVRNLFFKQLQISLIFGLLVYLGYFFYSSHFIKLWMLQPAFDQKAVNASAGVMSLLAISSIPLLIVTPCQNILAAIGRIRFTATLSVVEAFTNILLSIFFVTVLNWGLIGVAAGTTVARLLVPSIILTFAACREIGVPIGKFTTSLILPAIVSAGIFSTFCFFSLNSFEPKEWGSFSLNVIISSIFWFFSAGIFLLPAAIKKRIYHKIFRKGLTIGTVD